MAVERSCCHLEIPKELASILASVDGRDYGCPVWSFSKHNSGYSLKLFWKSQHCKPSPNNTHFVSATHSNKKRNIQRMEAFLAKKRAGVPATTSQQTASETVSEESPTTLSYADALATGAGTIASAQDEIIQCPSKTCGSLLVPQSSGNVQIYDASDAVPTKPLSPEASRTRSKVSKGSQNEFKPAESLHRGVERSASPTAVRTCDVPALSVTDSNLHLVLELPAKLTSITKHYIRCDDLDVANSIKDAMQHQWSSLVRS